MKRGEKMSPKGRPTQDKRDKRFEIRLSNDTYKTLEECSEQLGVTKSEVIHKGIAMVKEELDKLITQSKYKIIDFHTHPFLTDKTNICSHLEYANMSAKNTKRDFQKIGVVKICGSVIDRVPPRQSTTFEHLRRLNDEAFALRDLYKGFYIPGIHVHPGFVKESIAEIERANRNGVKLIGELVPYMHGWENYACKEFSEILEVAAHYRMIVNFHSGGEDEMDEMVRNHKDVLFVAAHPGSAENFKRHLKRMEMSENYFLDLSGSGIMRHGLLRHGIDEFGAERFLFGSDYPTCNPAMFIGGVAFDFLITDNEKQKIFYQNAFKLLSL